MRASAWSYWRIASFIIIILIKMIGASSFVAYTDILCFSYVADINIILSQTTLLQE